MIEEQTGVGTTYSVDPAKDTAKVNVRDDDSPTPVLSIAGPTDPITEAANAVAEFVVTSKQTDGTALNPANPITIHYNVADHASQDFLAAADEGDKATAEAVTFSDDGSGNFTYSISVPIAVNKVAQSDGDITVSLRADTLNPVTYTIDTNTANQSATALIVDTVVVSFNSTTVTASEENTLSFVVELSEKVVAKENEATSVLVYYEILGSTASSGIDFIEPSLNYVQFRYNHHAEMVDDPNNPGSQIANPDFSQYDGDIRQTIEIQLIDDELHEADETLQLRLTRATRGVVISTTEGTATGTIEENDFVYVTIDETSALEGDSGNIDVPITVRLSTLSTSDLTVNWEAKSVISNPPSASDDTATADTDYVAVANGTTLIRAGNLTGTFNVQFKGDTDDTEDNETFTVNIKEVTPSHNIALSSGRSAKITIKEDDRPVLTIAGDSPVVEAASANATFTITSTAMPTGGTLTVNYTPVSANFIANSGNPVTPTTPLNFTDTGNGITAPLSISLVDDDARESNEYLDVTLDTGTGYTVGDTATARVHISDDDAPQVGLTITGPSDQVFEGGNAVFTITADADPERTMDVHYTSAESGGDFLATDIEGVTETASSLDFTGADRTATISIPIENDAVLENTGDITVTLIEQAVGARKEYTLGSDPSATATIQDDDASLFAIWPGSRVIEGSDSHAEFTVRTNKSPDAVVPIRISFDRKYLPSSESSKTGNDTIPLDFRGETRNHPHFGQITVTPPKTEVTFRLPLNPANATIAPFTNGEFEVTLLPDDALNIRYAVRPTPRNVATVGILDNDVPELAIVAGSPVVEGVDTNASFEVTATTSPNEILPVKISFDRTYFPDSSTNKTGSDETYRLDFSGGKTTAELTLPLKPDMNETIPTFSGGRFNVSFDAVSGGASNYVVAAAPDNAASVIVFDDSNIPEINIASKVSSVVENAGPAMFTVTATGGNIAGKTLLVQYKPAEVATGEFLHEDEKTGTDPLSINLTFTDDGSGNFTQDIPVRLFDDSIAEATGEIEVVLHAPTANTAENQYYSIGSQNSAKMTIYDDEAPELSIADAAAIVEGTDSEAVFPISAKVSPNKVLAVRYTVSQPNSGYDYALSTGTTTARLDFTTGKTTANLLITIVDDNRADSNGIIRVTLEEISVTTNDVGEVVVDRQYTVSAVTGEDSGDAMVTDNDPTPLLTIAPPANPVAENAGVANYVITSTIDLGSGFKVRYDPSEVVGDYLDETASPSQAAITTQAIDFVYSGSDYVAVLAVPIHDDRVGEDTGEIQVELLIGDSTTETYNVATDGSQTQTVTILDDNAPVLIIGDAGTVTEWTDAGIAFPLTVLVSPNSGFNIIYTLEESGGDFVNDRFEKSGNTRTVFFHRGNTRETLFIPIESDDIEEVNSTVTVTLEPDNRPTLADSAWNLASPNRSATATVVNYLPPLATLSTEFSTITRNTRLPFTVTVDPAPTEPIEIPIGAVWRKYSTR